MIGLRTGIASGCKAGLKAGISKDVLAIPAPATSLFLIIGQSNAKGTSDWSGQVGQSTVPVFDGEDTAESYQSQYPKAPLYTKVYSNPSLGGLIEQSWRPTQPYATAGSFNNGIEASLARLLVGYGYRPAIIKYAIGGSSLAADWVSGTNLGDLAVAFAQARQHELGLTLGGVLWDQGEADATDTNQASAYAANVTTLVAKFRAVWPNIPFIFKRLSASGGQAFNATVRTQQTSYASGDTHSTMVDTDDVELQTDNLHYVARGYQLMGDRFGLALIKQLVGANPTIASTNQPYFVGADAQKDKFSQTVNVKWWGGTLANDVGILVVAGALRNQAAQALTVAAGFSLIGTTQSTDGTDHVWLSLYWARASQATIDANSGHMPTVTMAGSNHSNWGKIYVFRNCVTSGTPYDAVASFLNGGYTTGCTFPGGTTTQANQLIAMFAAGNCANTQTGYSPNQNVLTSISNPAAKASLLKSSYDIEGLTLAEGVQCLSAGSGTIGAAGTFGSSTATYPFATLQANCSITLLGTSSGSAPSMAGVTKDATSNIYCPATAAEWTTALAAAGITSGGPSALHLLQEASGNAADSIGAFTLTATNAPSYANVDAGWTRKSVGMTDGGSQNFTNSAAGLPDPATTSMLCIVYAGLTATPTSAARGIARMASTSTQTIEIHSTTAPLAQIQAGSGQVNGTSNPGTTIRPWVLQHNATALTQRLFTDQDEVDATYAALAGKNIQLGKTNAALAAPVHINYAAWFFGAAAEISKDQLRKVLVVLGWAPGWI